MSPAGPLSFTHGPGDPLPRGNTAIRLFGVCSRVSLLVKNVKIMLDYIILNLVELSGESLSTRSVTFIIQYDKSVVYVLLVHNKFCFSILVDDVGIYEERNNLL